MIHCHILMFLYLYKTQKMSNPGFYSPSIFVLSDCFLYFILSFFQDYSTLTNLSNNILRFRTNKMIVLKYVMWSYFHILRRSPPPHISSQIDSRVPQCLLKIFLIFKSIKYIWIKSKHFTITKWDFL